jgi:hypothetical protein
MGTTFPMLVAPGLTRGKAAFGVKVEEEAKPRIKSGATKFLGDSTTNAMSPAHSIRSVKVSRHSPFFARRLPAVSNRHSRPHPARVVG